MQLLKRVAVQPDRAVIIVTHDSRVYRYGERIVYHRDYFDAGALVYEHIPLMGRAIWLLKKVL